MKDKPVKVSGPDHPITIEPKTARVVVSVAGHVIADTRDSLTLREAEYPEVYYKIEEDANAGFYLYAFEGGKCTHDYLQDTLALAKKFARDEFGVPEDAWHASTPTA